MQAGCRSARDDFGTPIDYLWAVVELREFAELHSLLRGALEFERVGEWAALREMSRCDRLATSKNSRARREVEGLAGRRLDGVLPENLRGLTDRLMACEPHAIGGLLAELRGADDPLRRRVAPGRLMPLVARRLSGESLGEADRKYLGRQLRELNPSQPVELSAAGRVSIGAVVHTSATSAAGASFAVTPSVAAHPLLGRVVATEGERVLVRLDPATRVPTPFRFDI